MRVALAGIGGAARRGHLPALQRLAARGIVEFLAACDLNVARLAAAPAARPYTDVRSMLRAAHLDLVVIATDPAAHIDLIREGFAHGCDILCEKPVVRTYAEYRRLRALRRSYPDRSLVPVHQYRYSPGWRRLISWVRSDPGEPFRFIVRVERSGTDPHANSSWRDDPASGGGLADHGVHYLALARQLHSGRMTVYSANRSYDDQGREHVRCQVAIGRDTLDVSVNYGGSRRQNTIKICRDDQAIWWIDDTVEWIDARRLRHRRTLPALSDRSHVDSLYLPLYEDILAHRGLASWRDDRWREVLDVSDALTLSTIIADDVTGSKSAVSNLSPVLSLRRQVGSKSLPVQHWGGEITDAGQ
jgi:predicted dehydrogenase